MTAVIVDTSAIVAARDEAHPEHAAVASVLDDPPGALVVSPLVAAEADYMLAAHFGPRCAQQFAADVVCDAYELAAWSARDHAAALRVSLRYGNEDYIGMADASNVVLADRYRTTQILSLDQRHFRNVQPLWGDGHFTLLPYDR